MSRKTNRLKNRLRLERERATRAWIPLAKERQRLEAESARLAAGRRALADERENLNRSVALRIRVKRDFARPMGPVFGLNIMFHPEEFRLAALTSAPRDQFMDRTYLARAKGHEIGQKVADVLLRCFNGELEAFEKAS